jgi:hypothetical protein
MKLDIKTIITLLTFAAAIGGFYYSTQDRLGHLEDQAVTMSKQIKQLKKNVRELSK